MKPEFPISIGLVGAPGSGKRVLADEFARISADWFAEKGSELDIVSNAGRVIEETFDHAMGNFASFSDNIWACFNRYERELQALRSGKSYISCGTAAEHLAHAGTGLENLFTGLATPDVQVRVQVGQLTMSQLTLLMNEQFRAYTFGFFLPLAGSALVLPGKDDGEANYNRRVDQGVRAIFSNFGIRIQVLDQPTIEEKAQEMFDTIKNIVENGVEVPAETESEGVPPVAVDTLAE